MELFVYGDHLRGLPRHAELAAGEFLGEVRTAPRYVLVALDGVHAALCSAGAAGSEVPGELYRISDRVYARILTREPVRMYRGCVVLANGRAVEASLVPRTAGVGHPVVPERAGWRAYLGRRSSPGRGIARLGRDRDLSRA